MDTDSIRLEYFKHGPGCYISARYAARATFSPLSGLLAHYAVEMFLKGHLSAGRTERELRAIGHDLNAAWASFKADYPAEDLSRFDATIAEIDRFWRIRYPERLVAEGMQCFVDWSGAAGRERPVSYGDRPSAIRVPSYHLSLHDLDGFVRTLFDLCSVNPAFFVGGMNEQARTYLYAGNAFFTPENIHAHRPPSPAAAE
jgi:hypothetical protein